jgi:hypothetical protein
MSSRFLILIAGAVIFGVGAWMALKPPELSELPTAAASVSETAPRPAGSMASSGKLAASSVLSIDPRTDGYRPAPASLRRTVYNDFLDAKQYRALYDRLRNSAEGQTGEGAYVLYEIARACATITDRSPSRNPAAGKTVEQRRDEFLAGIQSNDPLREKRIAAFEEVVVNRCAGFDGVTMTQAELNKMLADAVSMGDPKARALVIELDIQQARRSRWDRGTLSDTQIEDLKQVFATRDPAAILTAGRLLSNTYNDLTLRLGPDGQVVEPRALFNAWQVLSCDYGYPCGSENPRLLSACAYQSHCDATSLPDYLYYYGSTPHDSRLLSQYRNVLRTAVESGDWSQLTVVRGPRPPAAPAFYPGMTR